MVSQFHVLGPFLDVSLGHPGVVVLAVVRYFSIGILLQRPEGRTASTAPKANFRRKTLGQKVVSETDTSKNAQFHGFVFDLQVIASPLLDHIDVVLWVVKAQGCN